MVHIESRRSRKADDFFEILLEAECGSSRLKELTEELKKEIQRINECPTFSSGSQRLIRKLSRSMTTAESFGECTRESLCPLQHALFRQTLPSMMESRPIFSAFSLTILDEDQQRSQFPLELQHFSDPDVNVLLQLTAHAKCGQTVNERINRVTSKSIVLSNTHVNFRRMSYSSMVHLS